MSKNIRKESLTGLGDLILKFMTRTAVKLEIKLSYSRIFQTPVNLDNSVAVAADRVAVARNKKYREIFRYAVSPFA